MFYTVSCFWVGRCWVYGGRQRCPSGTCGHRLCCYPYSSGFTGQDQEPGKPDVSNRPLNGNVETGQLLFQTRGIYLSIKASGVVNTCLLPQVWQPLPVQRTLPGRTGGGGDRGWGRPGAVCEDITRIAPVLEATSLLWVLYP